MNADFAGLSTKYEPFDAYKIANIQQLFENGIVHFGLSFGIDVIATYIHLNTAFRIL
ncbi:hypothetical protein SDC9_166664 [bioreactor metagenome]|uniref:Uncharacterized protein n=1 Tax=bioreactor metagenome TaxID=1076179 RepID=A0A645FXN8_9ZZZZ